MRIEIPELVWPCHEGRKPRAGGGAHAMGVEIPDLMGVFKL